MTPPQTQRPDLHFGIQPVQIGDQIAIDIQIGDNFGLTFRMCFPQEVARNLSKAIKAAVEQAEVTLVKPPSTIATA